MTKVPKIGPHPTKHCCANGGGGGDRLTEPSGRLLTNIESEKKVDGALFILFTVSALAANETSANEAAKPSAIPFSMIEAPYGKTNKTAIPLCARLARYLHCRRSPGGRRTRAPRSQDASKRKAGIEQRPFRAFLRSTALGRSNARLRM